MAISESEKILGTDSAIAYMVFWNILGMDSINGISYFEFGHCRIEP